MPEKTFLGITSGDINGVGIELVLKTFSDTRMFEYCSPVLYCNSEVFKYYKSLLQLEEPFYKIINSTKDFEKGKLNIRVCSTESIEIKPGEASEAAGKFALSSIQMAIDDIKKGEIHNLLTCPIDKHSIQGDQFRFNGHTEFLANAFETDDFMMLLTSDELMVGLVTGHIPVDKVSSSLNKDLILGKLEILHDSLICDFGIEKPQIAVLGLNPHSGDNGVIGKEEIEHIKPAIKEASERGMMIFGPYPADGFFGNALYLKFDAVLAMYHDQGLIPFKHIAFHNGVNYTAGLPIVRTSPDHGTAFDIAGKGIADISSFVNAIFVNNRIYNQRMEHMNLIKNPLSFTKHRREKFSIGVPILK
jgi:4-hydroxythreonine-4-phosphate dehydrogenase